MENKFALWWRGWKRDRKYYPCLISTASKRLMSGSDMYDELIEIRPFGNEPDYDPVQFHKGLLCHRSLHARNKLRDGTGSSKAGIVYTRFPERIIKAFRYWMYQGHLSGPEVLGRHSDDEYEILTRNFKFLFDCWKCGWAFRTPEFQNAAIDALIRAIVNGPQQLRLEDLAAHVYQETTHTMLLRRFYVDVLIMTTEDFKDLREKMREREDTPRGLYSNLRNRRNELDGPKFVPRERLKEVFKQCDYHVHED